MSDETKKPVLELKTKEYVPYGVTTFADFDSSKAAQEAAREVMNLSDTFMQLLYNITYSDSITDKPAALMGLIAEFSARLTKESVAQGTDDLKKKEGRKKFERSDYLVNTSNDPADWKYLVVKESGKVDLEALDLAVDLLQKELLPEVSGSDYLALQSRVKNLYESLGVVAEKQPDFTKTLPNLFLWKEKETGKPMRWMMIYSNNAMDRDSVEPNLFKEQSHTAFVTLANAGVLPMPEAWVWHIPGSRWGVADHLMLLEGDDGFVMPIALGTVDPGMEGVAEKLSKERNLLVSHGVPRSMILYDETDKRLIDFAPTVEISPLKSDRAANELTAVLL